MKNRTLIIGFFLQAMVLIGMWINCQYPHWVGKEIVLEARPFDPRSLFLGNYARINLEIGSLDRSLAAANTRFIAQGQKVYVALEQKEDVWVAKNFSSVRPDGTYIVGRATYPFDFDQNYSRINLNFGIEEYYADPDTAKEIEDLARNRGTKTYVSVKLTENGVAALAGLIQR